MSVLSLILILGPEVSKKRHSVRLKLTPAKDPASRALSEQEPCNLYKNQTTASLRQQVKKSRTIQDWSQQLKS